MTQAADTSVINALLLHEAGGEVRVDSEWFAAWDPPAGSGYQVTEEGSEVVVRAVVVDTSASNGVPSESASQQTEDV